MERLITFFSGRMISVVLLIIFNVLLARMMAVNEYGLFAILVSLASIANTLGSLGAQRFLPKYISPARSPENASVVQSMALFFVLSRFFVVTLASGFCLAASGLWLSKDVTIGTESIIPLILLSVVSAMYADAEILSQSLNQQRVSRLVSISEPLIRTVTVVVLVLVHHMLSALDIVWIMVVTQGLAWAALAANGWFSLREKIMANVQTTTKPPRHEVIGIITSGYVSGLTALGASPPVIRLIAANLLTASEFAALSFVQTITLSLQRYSPGFLVFPFIEPTVMGWQTADKAERFIKAGAALSLISKIDAFIITSGILALCPIGSELLHFSAGNRIDPRALILLLSMAAIIASTIVRSCEVAASFTASYNSIFLSSGLSSVFVGILIFCGPYMGLTGVLVFPIIDSLTRSLVMELSAKKGGFGNVIDWPRILLCFGLIAIGVSLSELFFAHTGFNVLEKIGFSLIMVAAGLIVFYLIGPMRTVEVDLIASYVKSRRIRRLLTFLARR